MKIIPNGLNEVDDDLQFITSKTSELTNDSGFLTSETDPLSLHLDQTTPQTVSNGFPTFSAGISATSRVQTVTNAASITPSATSDDMVDVTALTQNITVNNPSGTPTNGQKMFIRIKANAAYTITWGNGYYAFANLPMPLYTLANDWIMFLFVWNSSTSYWELLSVTDKSGIITLDYINSRVGVNAPIPTATFSVSEKCAMNADGGFMIKLTNKTGGASVKGHVVHTNVGQDNSVIKVTDGVPDSIGVFYESGVADGAEAWVVVSGIAEVYFIGSTTRGHLARTFVTGEAGYVTGQALSEAIPTAPFATDKHFCEIGHVLATRTGAGLAKCVLHFN